MLVCKPPLRQRISSNDRSIFLAGSIEMGKADNWQVKVEQHFKDRNGIVLFNPRRDDWDSSWEQSINNAQFYTQVRWELDHLEKADDIIMHFEPNTMSPISLLEFGLYADSGKLLVSCPDGFWRKGNVEIVCEQYGIMCYNSIEELLLENF